mmetsp:Transcript_23308/g.22916  ORF Transcript_23308/g.22916 Transcript_23308/m.22916 type:complete len:400 (+) Transcript_23308:2791-3990(+)
MSNITVGGSEDWDTLDSGSEVTGEASEDVVENDEDLHEDDKVTAEIKSISKQGLALVQFDYALKEIEVELDSTVLLVEVVAGPETEQASLGFSWSCNETGSDYFSLQLEFEDPLEVAKYEGDYLRVTFLKNRHFRRKDKNVYIEQLFQMTEFVPTQLSKDGMSATLEALAGPIKDFMNTVGASNMAMNLCLAASLQYIWGMINCLQIIVNIPLFSIQIPGNAVLMYSILINFVQLDIIPTEGLYGSVFAFDDSEPLNSNFYDMGYESLNIITNLGSNFLFLAIILVLYLVHCLLKACRNLSKGNKLVYEFSSKHLFYSLILRFLLENYLTYSICALLHIKMLMFDNSSNTFASVMALISSGFLLLFPVFVTLFLLVNFQKLPEEGFYRKYGSLYENLRY